MVYLVLSVLALNPIAVAQGNKMGMLGMAADPHFSANHFLYLAYDYQLEPFDPRNPQFRLRLVRYRESHDKLVEPKTLIENLPAWSNHTGCRLRFAPDGTLYFTDRLDRDEDWQLNECPWEGCSSNVDSSPAAGNPFIGKENAHGAIWMLKPPESAGAGCSAWDRTS